MSNFPNWRGWLRVQPQHPDSVLSRLLDWDRRKGSQKWATCSYPEPFNLTAASCWTKLNQMTVREDAFIYRDNRTGFWVKAVACRQVSLADADDWLRQEQAAGAVAGWINDRYHAPRDPMPSMEELLEMDPYSNRGAKRGVKNWHSFHPVKTPMGIFESKKAAQDSLQISGVRLNKLIKEKPQDYYVLDKHDAAAFLAKKRLAD